MATVSHDLAFTTDDFWLAGTFISNDGSNYRFQSTAGFVEVSGTSLTDSSGTPTGGTYLDITVFSDAGFTTEVASYNSGSAIDFATYFSSGAITALAGTDTIDGSGGNDTTLSPVMAVPTRSMAATAATSMFSRTAISSPASPSPTRAPATPTRC